MKGMKVFMTVFMEGIKVFMKGSMSCIVWSSSHAMLDADTSCAYHFVVLFPSMLEQGGGAECFGCTLL
jgi:hypothetical protein